MNKFNITVCINCGKCYESYSTNPTCEQCLEKVDLKKSKEIELLKRKIEFSEKFGLDKTSFIFQAKQRLRTLEGRNV